MNHQHHVIKQLVVEITLANESDAWSLQQALSDILQQQLTPILERCFSKLGHPDNNYRIESLELDLGEFSLDELTSGVLERIEDTLIQVLPWQLELAPVESIIQQQDEDHDLQAQNVDPAFTAADRKTFFSLPEHLELLEYFIRTGLLPWWADNSQRELPEKSLKVLINENPNALKQLLALFINEPRSLQRLVSYFDDGQLMTQTALLASAPQELISSLLHTLQGVQVLLSQTGILATGFRSALWQSLLQVTITNEPAIFNQADFFDTVISRWARLQGLPQQVFTDSILQLQASAAMQDNEWLSAQKVSTPPHASSNEEPVTTQERLPDQSFNETDVLYINNAGLCILCPFLNTFFERLELIEKGHFLSLEARQCAVSLLHYLATDELKPPEYMLAFNKLLCGIDIDEVFELLTPLTALQIEACDELLGEIIAKAPILNEMSLNGFRGSFLLREGIISRGQAYWILRVDRKSYDLVLDQFPWDWGWIELPWIKYPIQVEW